MAGRVTFWRGGVTPLLEQAACRGGARAIKNAGRSEGPHGRRYCSTASKTHVGWRCLTRGKGDASHCDKNYTPTIWHVPCNDTSMDSARTDETLPTTPSGG